ncbi:ferritin-like domain-containing protein [Cellulophaga omnivescoria]|uniref:ferritin-like domain-containing protein n=1 Tax=Cellulophaga omnivescoria TaxID=1888890 RepID=UPI000984B2BA|nr:PA2169 family four-helix-bundle protein [Cellulophaga omnivescoria]WBU87894.1 PA2169 family four-helix-bundle protein [Cellulophaga omnivescoria]WKB79888.1 PA2169 family four-helix-bundle protein [Cellulophaga lytica]
MIRDIMKYTEEITNRLNNLLEKTYDAEKGYKLGAEKVENPSIKRFLESKVEQRYNFGHQLKSEILAYGHLPEKSGTIKGDLHRTWMNLTATLSSNEEERILDEVERGEQSFIEEYDDILNDKDMVLPPSTENLLIAQRNSVQSALNTAKVYQEMVS